jgi:hypothetical protein
MLHLIQDPERRSHLDDHARAESALAQFLITGSCDIAFVSPKADALRKIAQSV